VRKERRAPATTRRGWARRAREGADGTTGWTWTSRKPSRGPTPHTTSTFSRSCRTAFPARCHRCAPTEAPPSPQRPPAEPTEVPPSPPRPPGGAPRAAASEACPRAPALPRARPRRACGGAFSGCRSVSACRARRPRRVVCARALATRYASATSRDWAYTPQSDRFRQRFPSHRSALLRPGLRTRPWHFWAAGVCERLVTRSRDDGHSSKAARARERSSRVEGLPRV